MKENDKNEMINDKNKQELIKRRYTKVLVLISIVIPLSIVLSTFLAEGKQLIANYLQQKDIELLQKVDMAIISLNQQINSRKISVIFTSKSITLNTSQLQRQKKQHKNRNEEKIMREIDSLSKYELKYFTINKNPQHYQSNSDQQQNQMEKNIIKQNQSFVQIDSLQGIMLLKQIEEKKNQQQKIGKNPLQVYEKLAYNVVLFNINPKEHPMRKQQKKYFQLHLMNHFEQKSHLRSIMQNNGTFSEVNIKISLSSGHLSQIQHNFQSKITAFYEQQSFKSHQNIQTTKSRHQASEYYVVSILNQLQQTAKRSKFCNYLTANTPCKQHTIYFLYESDQNFNQIFTQDKESIKQSENINQKNRLNIINDENDKSYWTIQDHSASLIVLPSVQSQYSLEQSLKSISTTIQQLIYQSLHLSQLLLLSSISQNVQNYTQLQLNSKQIINTFIQLNLMYKQLNLLHMIKSIANNTNIPYKRITDEKRQILLSNLQKIANPSQKYINFIYYKTINQLNQIDTFPTDYKLGALAPVVIILLYPLLNFIPYFFK